MKNPPKIKKAFSSVLVIDDEEMDLFVAKQLLSIYRVTKKVYTESSAVKALKFLKDTKELPELIFVDLLMPEMDGLDFMKEFSKLPSHITETCKIAVLSSFADHHYASISEAKKYHFFCHAFSKPLDLKELQLILAN